MQKYFLKKLQVYLSIDVGEYFVLRFVCGAWSDMNFVGPVGASRRL